MLKTVKVDDYYEVRVESNNKIIGQFIQDVDGFFYFKEENKLSGLWSDYILLELGTKLKEINEPWSNHLNEYFKNQELK